MGEPSDPNEASRQIKEHAAKQKILLDVSEEQARALLSQWSGGDPQAPAEISFLIEGKERVNLKVAGYWYAGDTCCA